MRTMKLVGLCLVLGIVGCERPKVPPVAEWETYTHVEKHGTMSARFPHTPRVQNISIPSPVGKLKFPYVHYENRRENIGLALGTLTYPVDPRSYNVGEGLRGAIQGAATNVRGKVTSEKSIFMYGLPGKEAEIVSARGEAARVRVFIDPTGPTIYQALFTGKPGNLDGPRAQAFFDSLQIETKSKFAHNAR